SVAARGDVGIRFLRTRERVDDEVRADRVAAGGEPSGEDPAVRSVASLDVIPHDDERIVVVTGDARIEFAAAAVAADLELRPERSARGVEPLAANLLVADHEGHLPGLEIAPDDDEVARLRAPADGRGELRGVAEIRPRRELWRRRVAGRV